MPTTTPLKRCHGQALRNFPCSRVIAESQFGERRLPKTNFGTRQTGDKIVLGKLSDDKIRYLPGQGFGSAARRSG